MPSKILLTAATWLVLSLGQAASAGTTVTANGAPIDIQVLKQQHVADKNALIAASAKLTAAQIARDAPTAEYSRARARLQGDATMVQQAVLSLQTANSRLPSAQMNVTKSETNLATARAKQDAFLGTVAQLTSEVTQDEISVAQSQAALTAAQTTVANRRTQRANDQAARAPSAVLVADDAAIKSAVQALAAANTVHQANTAELNKDRINLATAKGLATAVQQAQTGLANMQRQLFDAQGVVQAAQGMLATRQTTYSANEAIYLAAEVKYKAALADQEAARLEYVAAMNKLAQTEALMRSLGLAT
jgi:chromosome segregation ATPase